MKLKPTVIISFLLTLSSIFYTSHPLFAQERYKPTWESLDARPIP